MKRWLIGGAVALLFSTLPGLLDRAVAAIPPTVEIRRFDMQFHTEAKATQLMLSQAGVNVPLDDIEQWDDATINQADDFAGARHLQGNGVPVPEFLKPYEVRS